MDLEFVEKHRFIIEIMLKVNNYVFNKMKIKKGNAINVKCAFLSKCRIKVIGTGNVVTIEDYSRLENCKIIIYGNNCNVHIGKRCCFNELTIYMEDDQNLIDVGEHTSIDGKTELACIEGTKINIGNDCMFSRNIHVRTGDAHSIVNIQSDRINPSKDIIIKDHTWIGTETIIMKGAVINENSIIGAGAIVLSKEFSANSIIAGNPAKVIKSDISWKRERI